VFNNLYLRRIYFKLFCINLSIDNDLFAKIEKEAIAKSTTVNLLTIVVYKKCLLLKTAINEAGIIRRRWVNSKSYLRELAVIVAYRPLFGGR
jgi:hypothetical protein